MKASSESGLWATRIVRGMGPFGRRRADGQTVGRSVVELQTCVSGFLVRGVGLALELVDHRLMLLILLASRGALGREVGAEVALGLLAAGGVVLEAGRGTANDVAEQMPPVAGQNGVGQRERARHVTHLHAEHRGGA